jgi:YegS/Rv2252/BmrU family lipid kinase
MLAQEAIKAGADAVAVHGGDGTVMEVASGLIGSGVPMAIIPGGTANVMAAELGIPNDLVEACALAVNPKSALRAVDVGQVGEAYFILRAGMGFEAAMVEGADRDLKDRLGVLAYAFSALQALADPVIARYHLYLDGLEVETAGLTCIIANSGATGAPGVSLAPMIDVSDGLLDVIVVRKADLPSLISLAARVVRGEESSQTLLHWQAREVTVVADPPQTVQVDGEILGKTPVMARVIPHAVKIIVPQIRNVPGKENRS